MRSQDEIVAALKDKKTFTGLFVETFAVEVLTEFLDRDHVAQVAKVDSLPADWAPSLLTRESAVEAMREYVARIGWPKVQDHRGLSAERTLIKCSAWMWLLGDETVYDQWIATVEYAQYGAQILKLICEHYEFPIPGDGATQRMMRGEPCGPYCEEGCGT